MVKLLWRSWVCMIWQTRGGRLRRDLESCWRREMLPSWNGNLGNSSSTSIHRYPIPDYTPAVTKRESTKVWLKKFAFHHHFVNVLVKSALRHLCVMKEAHSQSVGIYGDVCWASTSTRDESCRIIPVTALQSNRVSMVSGLNNQTHHPASSSS